MSQLDLEPPPSTSERLGSAASSLGIVPFGFHAKTKYDANESLIQIRSDNHFIKPVPKDDDIWKRPPPDFRPQIFAPKPPKRNSRESMQPWLYGTIPGQRVIVKRPKRATTTHLLARPKDDDGRFVTQFHIDRPFTAKKKFVTEGMYKAGKYNMPQPHDYRDYPPLKKLGLQEFDVDREHDPFNIKFNTDRLNIIHGERLDKATDRNIKGLQMAGPLPPALHWDRTLILDSEPFPTKPGAYTRFKLRNRPAHSAFMERVTGTLEERWYKEKFEKLLQAQS